MSVLSEKINEVAPQTLADLGTLVGIPSISSMPEHNADVRRSADQIATWLHELDCPEVSVISEGGQPAVIAHFPAPAGKPTICLYSHHDVQPVGDLAAWTSDPFTATERGGRLYGRGTADDKGGVAAHLAALRAFDGKPPIGVKLLLEGEEEIGSPTMANIIERHHDELVADAFVIEDSANWDVAEPAFTTSLRGVVDCVIEVRTLSHGVHSGAFGGVVPDAITALCRTLATLHTDEGDVAIPGLFRKAAADLEYPLDRLTAETGLLPGVSQIGHGSVVERLWTAPSVSVLAIDAPRIADAVNLIIPVASAKVSLRIAPGQNADEAMAALMKHLADHVPWGAKVTVTPGEAGKPGIIPTTGPIFEAADSALEEAWGRKAVTTGLGGSIPLVTDLQNAFPGSTVLVTAVADPGCGEHGVDESLHLEDWRKASLAEALIMERLSR